MTKKIIWFIIIAIIITSGVIAMVKLKADNKPIEQKTDETPVERINNDKLTLFVGDGCPHCKKVEDWISAKKLDQKLNVEIKEVWHNKDNAGTMQSLADSCGIPKDDLGVPMLYDETTKKCSVGEVEAESVLAQKAGIEAPSE